MGLAQARVGDTTIGTGSHGKDCCPHTFIGTIVQGCSTVEVNGRGAATVTSITVHACPHCGVGIVIGSSGDVGGEGKGLARVTDAVNEICGMGVIITGSDNVSVG